MPLKFGSKRTEPTRRMLFTYEGEKGKGMKESGFGGFVSLWWIERENRGSQKEKCKNRIAPLPWHLSSLPIYPITSPLALLLPSPALPSSSDVPCSSLFHSRCRARGISRTQNHGISQNWTLFDWTVCFKEKEKRRGSLMCGTGSVSLLLPSKTMQSSQKKRQKTAKLIP